MKSIELELEIGEEKKVFTCTKVKGILLRRTASIAKTFEKMEKEFSDDILDELVDYVVDVFAKQFTREEFYNGIDIEDMVLTIQKIAGDIMEKASSKIKN